MFLINARIIIYDTFLTNYLFLCLPILIVISIVVIKSAKAFENKFKKKCVVK